MPSRRRFSHGYGSDGRGSVGAWEDREEGTGYGREEYPYGIFARNNDPVSPSEEESEGPVPEYRRGHADLELPAGRENDWSYGSSRPETHAGQPLVQNWGNIHLPLPSSSQQEQPSQDAARENPPYHYPKRKVNYHSVNRGHAQFTLPRRQPVESYDPCSQTHPSWDPGRQPFIPRQPRSPPPSNPPCPLATLQTPQQPSDSYMSRLKAELDAFKVKEKERVKEKIEELETTLRQDYEARIQNLREELEKAQQETAATIERQVILVEQARSQGERDAWDKFEQGRREELEKAEHQAEERREIEREVRAELEAERQAEIDHQDAMERLYQELQRQAMNSVTEGLEEAVALSTARLPRNTETDKELLRAELLASISSHLRQGLVLSRESRESDRTSSRGRKARSRSRPRSHRYRAEYATVRDATPSSRKPSRDSRQEARLPPAPDVPREACEREEEDNDMIDRSTDTWVDWHSVPDFLSAYQPQQHSSRGHGGTANSDHQAHKKWVWQLLLDSLTDAVKDRMSLPPTWQAPGPYDEQNDAIFKRQSPTGPHSYVDMAGGEPLFGEVGTIKGLSQDGEQHRHGGGGIVPTRNVSHGLGADQNV